ncbi:hypothetical protein [Flavobacterium sp.]|uniref:hypothetical protein n=1 Tax=Flavobacterium sp. TaxID=239 RepID=UPI001207B589|nr:hypothetical protein [Flavobacterium sp.]RZJ71072.1 MAG: hypothetical protein EOO49_11505 [Flavobacterium sp.]
MRSKKKIIQINIPTAWNELTDRQLFRLAAVMYSSKSGKALYVAVWMILVNVRWWQFRKMGKNLRILSEVPMWDLAESFGYIFTNRNLTRFPNGIRDNSGHLHFPPQVALGDLTIEEYALAVDLHDMFMENKDTEYLQMIAAILYSPLGLGRRALDRSALPHLSDSFSKVPKEQLFAISLALSGSRAAIENRFKKAFERKTPTAEKLDRPAKPKQSLAEVIRAMTQGDLSKYKEICHVNVYVFMAQFQQDIVTAKENKLKSRNAK